MKTTQRLLGIGALIVLVGVMILPAFPAQAREENEKNENAIEKVLEKKNELLEKFADKKIGDAFSGERETSLNIKPNSKVRMTMAVVEQVVFPVCNASSVCTTVVPQLNVKLFGLAFSMNPSSAKIVGSQGVMSGADIKVGDRLTIEGDISAAGVVTPTLIRDMDRQGENKEKTEVQKKIDALLEQVRKLQEKLKSL